MKRLLSTAAVLSMFAAFGCASTVPAPLAAGDAASVQPAAETAAVKGSAAEETAGEATQGSASDAAEAAQDEGKQAAQADAVAPWGTGDFVVYRFTGSFRKAPVTITEKVVARQGDTFTLDVTYDDGKTKEAIRARLKGESPARAEVLSVARLSRGVEQPASASLFEEIFARVALAADQNEALLGSEAVKLDVAGHGAVACERMTFRVKVGARTATMRTLASPAFAWGDLGGEITAAGGEVLYKAEIVDAGHEAAKPAIASADDEY